MRPAYITATRSHMRATMPRLWVTKIIASRCCCLQLLQEVEVLRLDRQVEARRGLVGDEQARRRRDGHGADHALAHAAGHLVRERAQPLRAGAGMRTDAEQRRRALRERAAAEPVVRGDRLAHLHADREHRVQRAHRVLQDHGDLAAADALHLALALREEIVAVEQDLAADDARRRPRREPHQAQARHALAGAGLADEPERLALAHGERHAVHGLDRAPARDEVRAQLANVDDRGERRRSPRPPDASDPSQLAQLRVERVAQPVPEQVEGEHDEQDGERRARTRPTTRS